MLPVRELAVQLRVNPNTVAKAYRLMQDEGLLVSRPGGGTFIAVPEAFSLRREREEAIAAQLGRLVAKAKAFDIGRNGSASFLTMHGNGRLAINMEWRGEVWIRRWQ